MKFRLRNKIKANKQEDKIIALKTHDGKIITYLTVELLENLRRMVTRIYYKDGLPKKLSLTSAIRQEGVTYIAWALGMILAEDLQKKVCVLELNWWFPTEQLAFAQEQGVASLIKDELELDEAVIQTNFENLSLLPAGFLPQEQRSIIARSDKLIEIIEQLSEQFDYVLLDIPAVRGTSDAIPLAAIADKCCLVVRQGVTDLADVRLALDDIGHLPILGVIMNSVSLNTPSILMKLIPQT
jgi:Mrp family chromosome partitioning ATPase